MNLKEAQDRFVRIASAIPALRERAREMKEQARETERMHRMSPTPEGEVVLAAELAMAREARAAIFRALDDLEGARRECANAWESRKDGES